MAAVAARSLPLLGILRSLLTLLLAAGAVRGELPYIGPFENANSAWAMALVTISLWAVYLLWKAPRWRADAWGRSGGSNPRELFEIENESRGTLGQILSGVAVLTGLIFAWQQLGQTSDNLRVSQEGQITDRFSRAVDQLGSDDLTVRLGGIYALERIARDSPRDHGPVMEVLTAFARQESPLPIAAAATPAASAPAMPFEVEAVLKVIGRRTPAQVTADLEEGGCLELTGINAVGTDLAGYNLQNTCWDRPDLRGATMVRADLSDATFAGSSLVHLRASTWSPTCELKFGERIGSETGLTVLIRNAGAYDRIATACPHPRPQKVTPSKGAKGAKATRGRGHGRGAGQPRQRDPITQTSYQPLGVIGATVLNNCKSPPTKVPAAS